VLTSTAVSISLHRDSGLLAVVSDNMVIRIINIETRRIVKELTGFHGRVLDIVSNVTVQGYSGAHVLDRFCGLIFGKHTCLPFKLSFGLHICLPLHDKLCFQPKTSSPPGPQSHSCTSVEMPRTRTGMAVISEGRWLQSSHSIIASMAPFNTHITLKDSGDIEHPFQRQALRRI